MLIKKIKVENFKSFKELCIIPSNFNVLIGPNASGKSNFLQIFRFIRDIVNFGLPNAISLQGGANYLRNIHLGTKNNQTKFQIELIYVNSTKALKIIDNKKIKMKPLKFRTNFTIQYTNNSEEYFVKEDYLFQEFSFFEEIENENDVEIGNGILEFRQINDEISQNFSYNSINKNEKSDFNIKINDIIPSIFIECNSSKNKKMENCKTLFFENQYNIPHPYSARKTLGELPIYDLDPLQSRSISLIAGKTQLEENGENIAIVLKKILNNEEKTRQFFNYITHILPFIEDIEIEKFLDKHLQIKVKEKYTPNETLPASLMSSGSVTLISIIIALFFENKKISIFEEPAGKVHPYLIAKMIDMMKDASQKMQIFLTTHNPEIVKFAGFANIFYLLRNSEGFSVISHISQKEEIFEFIKNEIGLEELFVQNLLSK